MTPQLSGAELTETELYFRDICTDAKLEVLNIETTPAGTVWVSIAPYRGDMLHLVRKLYRGMSLSAPFSVVSTEMPNSGRATEALEFRLLAARS